MGLDFSSSDAHWSYGGFMRFRSRLADEIGINLDTMEGFGGDKSWRNVNDPIKDFLNHSDCDGELSPRQCKIIAPRLLELVSLWEDDYDKRQAVILANDMKECALNNETLEFC